jgi:hypothetical protein
MRLGRVAEEGLTRVRMVQPIRDVTTSGWRREWIMGSVDQPKLKSCATSSRCGSSTFVAGLSPEAVETVLGVLEPTRATATFCGGSW